jgi:hypothetical protein
MELPESPVVLRDWFAKIHYTYVVDTLMRIARMRILANEAVNAAANANVAWSPDSRSAPSSEQHPMHILADAMQREVDQCQASFRGYLAPHPNADVEKRLLEEMHEFILENQPLIAKYKIALG